MPHRIAALKLRGQVAELRQKTNSEAGHSSMCGAPTEPQEKGQRPTRGKDASTLGRERKRGLVPQACSWVEEKRRVWLEQT